MDELYDDLENYDDVDAVNKLKTENSELKHRLGECNKSIEMLQKDFDKLTADFKALQNNYSSLLKSARAEIERKTEMITNLNIEKDMLIITAAQKAPANKIQKIVKNLQIKAKRKKTKQCNIAGKGPKDRTEFIRRECERPPSSEASSTATDNSNTMVGNERLLDNTGTSIRLTQENQAHKREAFPNHRVDGNRSPVPVDRRLSALACPQFSKLSSDEEFEDLYSALKPKTDRNREPERNRKRGRDDCEDSKTFYNNTYDRPSNYPDPSREHFNTNRTGRYSNNNKNVNRDKQYNESDRNMNRDKQYGNNKSDKYDSHYQRYSPERHRRGAKEHPDDRYTQQYDRNRRLVSPPRERNHHRSRERRRSCHDRERQEYKQDAHRSHYPETHSVRHHIHGEYDEPQNKRPRIDSLFPINQEDRRLNEKQHSNQRDHTCQSPDFSHEDSSNEPIPEIRSTASMLLDDPRITSKKYVISTEGNKEILQSANANKIYLQPVNKSLWNLQEVQVPNALKSRPSEISEELVEEMYLDKPLSIISMESGEIGSETTDTVTDDVSDFLEVNKSNYKYGSCIVDQHRREKPRECTSRDIGYKSNPLEKHHSKKSPMENKPKDIGYKSEVLDKQRNGNSPMEKISKDIGYKSDVLEKLHKEKSSIETTSKGIGYKSDVLEKHRKEKSPIETTSKDIKHKSYKEKHHKEKSPIENTSKGIGYKSDILDTHIKEKSIEKTSNDIVYKSDVLEKHQKEKSLIDNTYDVVEKEAKTRSKLVKSEKTNHRRADEPTTTPRDNYNKVATNKHNETPSILQRLINSVLDKSPERNSSVKSSKSKEEKERNETPESRTMDKTEQEASTPLEQTERKKSSEPENESQSSVQIFREFEHRVYSTRHIVEGDLELSDDSNDEKQLKKDEKKTVKGKPRIRKKSTRDACKEKPVDLKDARITRSKKDKNKEDKTTNKFSALFGDSSSLITPEDLNLATRAAHALPADCCPPAPEDAQDGIIESEESVQTLTSKVLNINWETKENSDAPTNYEDKRKAKVTKDIKNRIHKRHKKSESVTDDAHNAPDRRELNQVKKNTNSTDTISELEVKLLLSNESLKQMQNAKVNTDTNSDDVLNPNEKPKASVKSNKRLKNKGEKKFSSSDPVEESNTNKPYSLEATDNKENTRGNDNAEGNISSEMARIFENTGSDVSNVNNEKLSVQYSAKGTTSSSTVVQDVPNLAPVLDEPGLVKTIVISTGIQLLDSNSTQHATEFNALASSTPAKELSIVNTSSEMEPKISHSAQVSVTIERDDTVSQSENDAPDIRINYYRRRRKVLKR